MFREVLVPAPENNKVPLGERNARVVFHLFWRKVIREWYDGELGADTMRGKSVIRGGELIGVELKSLGDFIMGERFDVFTIQEVVKGWGEECVKI